MMWYFESLLKKKYADFIKCLGVSLVFQCIGNHFLKAAGLYFLFLGMANLNPFFCRSYFILYLGFTITPDARCDTEIKKRVALSKDTFTKMKSIFTNRNIKIYTKINYIWSILLYGCECWTYLERRLEAAEMWYMRRIMRISWTEKKSSNEEVMEMAGYKRSLLKTIGKRQLQFLGGI